eukprot:m.59712 g.59712  ORF g.59712 m.59712 type:complete len:54 (+) comp11266_c0_seq2:709-870(+)
MVQLAVIMVCVKDLLTVSLSDDDEEEDVIIPSVANLPTIEIDHGADTDEKTSL